MEDSNQAPRSTSGDLEVFKKAAFRCLTDGNYLEAVRCLSRVMDLEPNDAENHRNFAKALAKSGNLEQSIDELQRALHLWPNSASIQYDLATLFLERGRLEEALKALSDCISLEPNHLEAYEKFPQLLRTLGRNSEAMACLKELLRIAPNRLETIHFVGQELTQMNRPLEAVVLLKHATRLDSSSVKSFRLLGLAELLSGKFDEAMTSFDQALKLEPRHVQSHLNLAITYKRAGRMEEAIAAYESGIFLHRAKPMDWFPEFEREIAELNLIWESRNHDSSNSSTLNVNLDATSMEEKVLTIIVGCYGDFPQYSVRAIESIAAGVNVKQFFDVIIGLNECCTETKETARRSADSGIADFVIESRHNLNKDTMLRLCIDMVRTPYFLWIDDDSFFSDSQWPERFSKAARDLHPFDVAGQFAKWGPRRESDERYMRFIRARPWWRTIEFQSAALRDWIPFVRGGLFLGRTAFLRQHDFPDRGMIKAMDDVALGELVQQVGGRLVALPNSLLQMAQIGEGHRRGTDFELNA